MLDYPRTATGYTVAAGTHASTPFTFFPIGHGLVVRVKSLLYIAIPMLRKQNYLSTARAMDAYERTRPRVSTAIACDGMM